MDMTVRRDSEAGLRHRVNDMYARIPRSESNLGHCFLFLRLKDGVHSGSTEFKSKPENNQLQM